MPPEIVALLDKPWLLAIVLAIGAALGMFIERFVEAQKRAERRAYWQGRNAKKNGPNLKSIERLEAKQAQATDMATDQLRVVMRAKFAARALLNRPEAKVFVALDQAVIARNSAWQVMAQVSLGEFLASPDKDAYLAVNSKRVDFALMDENCEVRHAIEYQGNGHHQGSAAARDAVKKEALRKAGIGYHEVVAGHTTPAELKRLVEKLVPLPKDQETPPAPSS
ncbi:DUF2726 domain-containing protein [Altererythrobacter sp. Z27]|uniref:DUF2726 domain-containing protein n=1 Tax=Altererythrobacter sp. Z27 TaxID=3461147 RepID=UPI0040446386